jgi:hypothetical protein
MYSDLESCPVLRDPDALAYLRWLYERAEFSRQIRARRIEVLADILTRHKLPLHWEVIAKVALEEAPTLFESADSVRSTLFLNRPVFRQQEGGVFELETAGKKDNLGEV